MITIIGKEGCSRCKTVENICEKRGIEYSYLEIDNMENRDEIVDMIVKQNKGMYPLLLEGDKVLSLKEVLEKGK